MKYGKIFGIGVGPGDPELLTIKALNTIKTQEIIVYHQSQKKQSRALKTVEQYITAQHKLIPLTYPVTNEISYSSQTYKAELRSFYLAVKKQLEPYLIAGKDICIITEGDPLFYSSFMYIYDMFAKNYSIEIIPGISSIFASAASLQKPLASRDQTFGIIPGTLSKEYLKKYIISYDNFIIIKIGKNFKKIKNILTELNLDHQTSYIEYASLKEEKIIAFKDINSDVMPYFSMILVTKDIVDL